MMPQMRTISQAAAWLHERDPNTAMTLTALRRLVTTGKVPSVQVGAKYLIDLQTLAQYLQGDIPPKEVSQNE